MSQHIQCDHCQHDNSPNTAICNQCNSLVKCGYEDYFAALGVDPLERDVGVLERQFLKKMVKIHPDKFVAADEGMKSRALEHAAYINQAYETLKSDIKYIEYFLKLHGYDIAHYSVNNNSEFLIKTMMWRENEDMDTLRENLKKERVEYIHSAINALKHMEYEKAIALYCELKFLNRFQQEINGG